MCHAIFSVKRIWTCCVLLEKLWPQQPGVHINIHLSLMRKRGCPMQAFNNASRILVELSRAYGDVILFVKQEDSEDGGPTSESLPSEQDAYKYADLVGFQNRLSNHHRFINGSGNFYIGVYNTDRCLEEDTIFNLTITIATPTAPLNLCPLNCSYPQGQCVRDNVCDCEPGYGGRYCSGCECQNTFYLEENSIFFYESA